MEYICNKGRSRKYEEGEGYKWGEGVSRYTFLCKPFSPILMVSVDETQPISFMGGEGSYVSIEDRPRSQT